MVIGFVLVVFGIVPSVQAQVVLYDESVSGDVADETNPENLGTLAANTYTISGSLCFGGACGTRDIGDAYCFEIPAGLEISSGQVELTNVVGVGGSVRLREWDGSCVLTGTAEDLGSITSGVHPLTLVPFQGPNHFGPGNFFGAGTVTDDSYDYEWPFVVTPIVPVDLMSFSVE